MNIIFSFALNVILFIFISILFYRMMIKYSKIYLILAIISYIGFTYIVLFPFADFITILLRTKMGVKISYSHNDMVLVTEMYFVCFFICILTIILSQVRKRRNKKV